MTKYQPRLTESCFVKLCFNDLLLYMLLFSIGSLIFRRGFEMRIDIFLILYILLN